MEKGRTGVFAMLDCRKLRRHQPAAAGRGTKVGYMHPDEAEARRRRGLFVSGTRAVTAHDAEGSEHTVYVLRCSYIEDGARVSWEVRRRYNDFFTLHTKLKRYGAVVAELPSRNPFAKLSSVVRSREIGLQEYLQAVLSHCNDQQCSYLAKFLQVQKNLPSYHRLWPPLPEGEETVQTKGGARPAQAQGHRADHSSRNDEQRGRSAESESGASPPITCPSPSHHLLLARSSAPYPYPIPTSPCRVCTSDAAANPGDSEHNTSACEEHAARNRQTVAASR